ncbi:glycosyl hydrolase family 43 [Bacteroides zoogleoformans]|uniref:Arabinan endo-1,5-alpha-L-arabinosidase n=1 Tax=Bacteroides zoogleoformans TaxID=28119 RepID=A0ABN5IH01_9BACE|nr:arabinan endo-1,5-alpha-L-arabinosidase [Bacteroides zoogleoformans]AVM52020.1 arabinan endo-1,5-alpha-L-arabinosidase [Bacteroides zoogleoformans]TWJ13946.1 glycosyl hydrolase family 43 [Bacteroides zoogleoformans]
MKLIKWLNLFTLGCTLFISMASCDDDDNNSGELKLGTPTVTDIAVPTATVLSEVTACREDIDMGRTRIMSYGFCYGTTGTPTIHDATVKTTPDNGKMTASLTSLKGNTEYHVRAFATLYPNGIIYSDDVSFTTNAQSTISELNDYVPPTYADNYTDIADWNQRNKWNLANVHDPGIVLAEDGYYYMYQTDASYGNTHIAGGHFHGRRSKDLVNWEYLGGTMKSLPAWIIPQLNEIRKAMGLVETTPAEKDFGYWAPCVRKVKDGLYRMYYSIVVPGYINGTGSWGERAFIGLMENNNPANNDGWEDKGYVITNASDKGLDYMVKPDDWANCYFKWNAIDPSYIIDKDGKHYLIYGSWHSGIASIEIDANTGKPATVLPKPWGTANEIAPYGKLLATRRMGNRWQGSEGAEIIYNAQTGYYYLFVAYDALDVPYNTRVCRSKDINGPYIGIDGTDLTNNGGDMLPVVTHPYKFSNSEGWVGIAHCAIFDDGKGNWFYASQGRFPKDVPNINASNAIMMGHIRSIRWTKDGWPVVMPERYGAVPQVPITEKELVGNWEHIDLSYSYGKQKTSDNMTLSADHKVTDGSWKGATWTYDAVNERISFSNGVEVCLQREVDWEANPRTHTIVYAGYGSSKTYWGKKSR